jgi:hypothetical protein
MQDNIFIPKKLKIGFQDRSDTYTKKLAYVIYYDEKNKLRKEQSWNSWRDKKIDPQDFDNVPTSGFVLNKKVGGCRYDWNVRNTYVRIYDPRGFEFEITIPNLLFILENTNSIKGKGLEGDFVYGWAGAELLLIPTCSPQYVELSKLNDLRHNKNHIKSKDLVLGATYLHKSNTPMVYMGKFNKYLYERWSSKKTGDPQGEYFFFIIPKNHTSNNDEDNVREQTNEIKAFKSLADYFIDVVDSSCTSSYAHLMEIVEKSPMFSPLDKSEYVAYTLSEFVKSFKKNSYKMIYLKVDDYAYADGYVTYCDRNKLAFQPYSPSYRSQYNIKSSVFVTIEQLFNELNPYYKNTYLANKKLFETTK